MSLMANDNVLYFIITLSRLSYHYSEEPILSLGHRLHLWHPKSKIATVRQDSAPSGTSVADLRPAGSNRIRDGILVFRYFI